MPNPDHPPRKPSRSPKKAGPPARKAKAPVPKTPAAAPSKASPAVADSFVHDDVECRIFRALADKAFFANVYADSEGIIRYANPHFAMMLEYRPEELVGQHVSIAHSPEQMKASTRLIETSVKSGRSEPEENWYTQRDGTEFPLLVGCVSIASPLDGTTFTAMSGVDISPILQARKAYQTLFNEMLDSFSHFEVIFDDSGKALDYRYLAVNPAWERAREQRAEDVVGKTLREVSPDFDPAWIEMAGRVATTGEPIRTTIHHESLDKYYEATVFCPAPGECAVILQDITEARKASEAYQTLFDEMLDGFAHHEIICDDSGKPVDYRYLAANPAFERMTGLKAKDLIGRTVREVLPGTEQYWIDSFGKVALTGEPNRFEDFSSALDKYFEVMAFCPAPGEFATTVQDVTTRKRAEKALLRSEQDLQRTQRLARVGSWTWDFAKDEITWTEVLYEVFGLEPSATAPTFLEQEALITAPTYKALNEAVARTRKTGIPYEVELEIPRDDGTTRWLWSRGEPVKNEDGKLTGLWGAAQDITERKNQETEKSLLEERLARAQRLESVGRLAGSVAHDFNNMLTVILGHVERNLERTERDDPVFSDLVEIGQVAERSAALTRQLLAFARNQPASPRIIDLNETVEAILVMLTRLVDEGITLNWNPGSSLSPVRIDPTQVDQILANLIINARDAIVDVGDITIETKSVSFNEEFCAWHPDCREGNYVELAVTDSGSGMDAETQARLFEPFFTTKDQEQGTGLGLSTVYGVVQQNDGFITVTSEPEVGTTFRINLPQQTVESESSSKPTMVKNDDSGTETVLLVEDEPAILRLTSTMLEGRGYSVLMADTPSEAIRLAEEHPGQIDLLLTDVIMPEMNGGVLADRLKSSRPNLQCLFMSGYTANVIATHGVPDDVPFISKPFHLTDLAAKVREVLDS